jgi:hypothetical protein
VRTVDGSQGIKEVLDDSMGHIADRSDAIRGKVGENFVENTAAGFKDFVKE